MKYQIEEREEKPRGCGMRKEGGLYLVSGKLAGRCYKLPIKLDVCPTCHAGIKPSRGWTWIDLEAIAKDLVCEAPRHSNECARCPVASPPSRCGLLWVGESFYKTPEAFADEATAMGVSRRIQGVPRDFKLGETWVAMAHRKTKIGSSAELVPAIFTLFKPIAIEYVVKKDDSDEKLERLQKSGLTLVRVKNAASADATSEDELDLDLGSDETRGNGPRL